MDSRKARALLLFALVAVALLVLFCQDNKNDTERADGWTQEEQPQEDIEPAPESGEELMAEPSDEAGDELAKADAEPAITTSKTRAQSYREAWSNKTGAAHDTFDKERDIDAEAVLHTTREPAASSNRYTVMVYMVGSDLESSSGAASDDIAEMTDSGLDFNCANVLVYAGGSRRWNSDVPSDRNVVMDLRLPEGERVVAQTDSNTNMGEPATLTAFLDFCCEHYAAEHMALVFWDHGGGPLWGFGVDQVNSGDGLLLPELREAMEKSPWAKDSADSNTNMRLDWVGFDACLMGSLESAVLWSEYADWMVASEELEPGDGWDWSWLSVLNAADAPDEVTGTILDCYASYYEAKATALSDPDVTLAQYDLSHTKSVIAALDKLVGSLEKDVHSGLYADVNRARRDTKAFGLSVVDSRFSGYDLIDLGDFTSDLADAHPKEEKALKVALSSLVTRHVGNVERANGISLYFPGENAELYLTYDEFGSLEEGDTASGAEDGKVRAVAPEPLVSATYNSFVSSYTDAWLTAADVDWKLAEPVITEEGPRLQLTDEQMSALSTATYTVLKESEEGSGSYSALMCDVRVDVGGDNTVQAPEDPQVIAAKTDLHTPLPGCYTQVDDTGGKATYVNNSLVLAAACGFKTIDWTTDASVNISVEVNKTNGQTRIASFSLNGEEQAATGKIVVDVTRYSAFFQRYWGLRIGYDESDNPLPWDEWPSTGGMRMAGMYVEDDYGIETYPASDLMESCMVQFVLTDVNGMRHASEPVRITLKDDERSARHEVVKKTKLGTLTFTLEDGRAILKRYEGDDWTIDIPTTVKGKPVTSIGNSAFSGTRFLDELVLPEGIVDIGSSAFAYSGVCTLTLPSTVRHIGHNAFRDMSHLEEYRLNGKSSAVSVHDGVLFSADGKTLIAYPQSKGTSYIVPKGTEILGYGSFANSNVREVKLPEGLKAIEQAAFFGCTSLQDLQLPQSLVRIDTLAFGCLSMRGVSVDESAHVETVVLGPNVKYVGPRAFSGLGLKSIEVDPANTNYQSNGGYLLNALGDVIIEAPTDVGSVVEIPEGVVALEPFAFYYYANNTEFILPDSLIRCDQTSLPFTYEDDGDGGQEISYECVIHASGGSYAESFAIDNGIAYDSNTNRDSLVYEVRSVKEGEITLQFRVYPDHATLVGVSDIVDEEKSLRSKQHELVIPNEVEGVPVTVMDSQLDTDFGYQSSITTLSIPSSLQTMGEGALREFTGLKRIELDKNNTCFSVRDGVLLTSDGTQLVAYPRAKEDAEYQVPDGVKAIRSYAFFSADNLERVVFPKSVTEIGAHAFEESGSLKSVVLGDSVQSIGDCAFEGCQQLELPTPLPPHLQTIGNSAFERIGSYEGLVLPKGLRSAGDYAFRIGYDYRDYEQTRPLSSDTLVLGSHVENIGSGAFEGLGCSAFEVAKKNKSYRAEGPFLLTADGQEVVAFASGYKGSVVVPDSVRVLSIDILSSAYGVTDITIPASVKFFSENWNVDHLGEQSNMRVYVERGSYAERFAQSEGLAWTTK